MIERNRVKEVRKEKGLSVLELSYQARISPNTLYSIESCKQYAYPGWQTRIAKALDVDRRELFGEE